MNTRTFVLRVTVTVPEARYGPPQHHEDAIKVEIRKALQAVVDDHVNVQITTSEGE